MQKYTKYNKICKEYTKIYNNIQEYTKNIQNIYIYIYIIYKNTHNIQKYTKIM